MQSALLKAALIAVVTAGVSMNGAFAESISLKSNESRKVSENISVNLEFFGEPYVSFSAAPNPQRKGLEDLDGFKTMRVYDAGKLWTITVESTTRQATKVRTTHGCKNSSRASACVFRVESVPSAAPPQSAFHREFKIPADASKFQKLNDNPLLYVRSFGNAIRAVTAGGGVCVQPWLQEGRIKKAGSVTLEVDGENPSSVKMHVDGKTSAPCIVEFTPE